jgi:hypothetical protein
MRAGGLLLLLLPASCASAATQQSTPPAADPEEPVTTVAPGPVPEALTLWTPTPRPGPPAKVEGHLRHPVCLGPVQPPDPPHKAACCYPAMEALKRPMRGIYPALRACYEARQNKAAEGRVGFAFRIEQDGSVKRVCATEGSAMDDEPALTCMVAVVQKVRWEAIGKEGRDFCGLISFLDYPVIFEP